MKNQHIQIKTIAQLKTVAQRGNEFFILLNLGLRSSKYINWMEEKNYFKIENHIDGSTQRLTEHEIMLKSYTLIGAAMKKGGLFLIVNN